MREKRDSVIDYNDIEISIADINRYTYLMIGTEEEILSRLPKKINDNLIITSIDELKGLLLLLDNHNNTYDGKILECEKATTKAQVEAIEV